MSVNNLPPSQGGGFEKGEKVNHCSCCGKEIPDGQSVCSVCYGDPDYGWDGYYQAELDAECEEEARKLDEHQAEDTP